MDMGFRALEALALEPRESYHKYLMPCAGSIACRVYLLQLFILHRIVVGGRGKVPGAGAPAPGMEGSEATQILLFCLLKVNQLHKTRVKNTCYPDLTRERR